MIIDFNRYNGGGSGSGSTDLSNYWNSAVTEQHIESAASITYASAVSYTDAALSGFTPAGDSTVLKAVEEFPEDPEMGDVVSKLMPADIASWNTSDNTTAKMHIDTDILNALDTGETYTIAEFPSVDGTIELVAKVQPSRSDLPAWCLYDYVGGEEGSIICQLTSTDEESAAYQIPNNMRAPAVYYTSVNYLEDDFSGKGGMMIQIGRITDPSNPTSWTGSYSEISGLELYPIGGGGHVVDGTYIYDGTEWKKTNLNILAAITTDEEYGAISGSVKTGDLIQVWGVDINDDGETEYGLFEAEVQEEEDGPGGDIIRIVYWERRDNQNSVTWAYKVYPWMNDNDVWPVDFGEGSFLISTDDTSEDEAYNGIGFDGDGKPVITHISPEYDEQTGEITGMTREDRDILGELDTLDDVVSAALVNLNNTKVESQDIRHMVKCTQAEYDQLVLDDEVDPETFYIIVNNSN